MNNHPWGTPMQGWAETREFIVAQRPFQTKNLNVAIFVFPLVQIIDLAGPYEVFQQAGAHTYTVGEKLDPIQTAAGLTIIPQYTFETAPKVDVLVLPGGDGVAIQLVNPAAIKWIRRTAKKTIEILTVCTGSFLAAKAGLLDGLSATTFYGALDALADEAPLTKVVWDKKYIDSGKVITAAGLSSGIDGSLYAVSKLLGKGHAQAVALHMEYDWQPNSTYARAMFPDMNIPKELPRALPPGSELLSSFGDRDHWTITVRVPHQKGAAAILTNVNSSLTKSGKWLNARTEAGANISRWNFTDRFGVKWQSVVSMTPSEGRDLLFTLQMDRI